MRYRRPATRKRRKQQSSSVASYLAIACLFGGAVGLGTTDRGAALLSSGAETLLSASRPTRARDPQPGDHWPGCNAARAAGTAPIYEGEPGYREGMDGDGDGIACEPYH